ncbi:MAG: hypothetical protein E7Z91_01600 [Cyanobacteria bacterium SIG30]|nr:hypothetical protein [Cyanobacteria bacterium SIG30]
MKKILSIIVFIFILISYSPIFAQQMKANAKTNRIPRGTKIELRMVDPVTTENVERGDIFTASLIQDVEIDGDIILPAGSLVRGTVGQIIPAKRLSRSAIMYMHFDHIVTHTGQQLPIKAGICSNFVIKSDGAIAGGGNYGDALKQNWGTTVKIVKNCADWGIVKGEQLFNGGKYLITPFSTIGGVLGGGIYYIGDAVVDLFKKGNDIVINQGKTFNILLLDNLDVPIW